MGYASGNLERHKQKRSAATDYNAVDDSDENHRVMMELEPLLEESGKRNWRSMMLTLMRFHAVVCYKNVGILGEVIWC